MIIVMMIMMMMMIDDDDDSNNNNNDDDNNKIVIVIIIAVKGTIGDFFFLQSPHCAAKRLQHVRSNGLGAIVCKSRAPHKALITCNMCANHVQHIKHLSCATCRVTCHVVRRGSSAKFDKVEIAFILALFYWLNHSPFYRLALRAAACLFVGCLTSQQHTSVSQGRICSDNYKCCHTELEVADQTFHLTQS